MSEDLLLENFDNKDILLNLGWKVARNIWSSYIVHKAKKNIL
jgi:predicted transport protein